MDSSVWISLIGVCGTLGGALVGAWLNPYMQEKREVIRLKKILKEATPLDKFIIFNAYRNVYFPLYKMFIYPNSQLDAKTQHLINHFHQSLNHLELNLRKMGAEGLLFIRDIYGEGCFLALNSRFSALINQDKTIREMLMAEDKQFIREKIYPLYEEIIESKNVFNLLQQPPHQLQPQIYQQQTQNENTTKIAILNYINTFMYAIGVFNITGDLSYLKLDSPKAYLNFPKGEFHPEYKG